MNLNPVFLSLIKLGFFVYFLCNHLAIIAVIIIIKIPFGLGVTWRCFKSSHQIQQHVSEFNRDYEDPIILKIGLYSGPAIAVNSNDWLDYFGRTVNIAARIQGESVGNDIVCSKGYLENEIIYSLLKQPSRGRLVQSSTKRNWWAHGFNKIKNVTMWVNFITPQIDNKHEHWLFCLAWSAGAWNIYAPVSLR